MKEHILGFKKLIITISILAFFPLCGFLLSNIKHLDTIDSKDVESLLLLSIGGGLILNSVVVLKEYYFKNLFKTRLNSIGLTEIKEFPVVMHETYTGWAYKLFYSADVNGQVIKIMPIIEKGTWSIPCIDIYNEDGIESETRIKVDTHLNLETVKLAIQKHAINQSVNLNSF
ncbi:MAG: hypothetical protein JO080_14185 [Mucilaginibacter sp.]|nr:hypothetical protein [Mucilaginibacter sp.]